MFFLTCSYCLQRNIVELVMAQRLSLEVGRWVWAAANVCHEQCTLYSVSCICFQVICNKPVYMVFSTEKVYTSNYIMEQAQ